MLIWCIQLNFSSESQIHCRTHFQQRTLVHCRQHTFSSESYFAAANTLLAANVNSLQITQFQQRITDSLQNTHFWQRMLIRCRQLNFGSESQIRYRQYPFDNKRWFTADNKLSVVNANSLQTTQFWEQMLTHYRQQNFSSECSFAADHSISTVNHRFVAEHTLSVHNLSLDSSRTHTCNNQFQHIICQ